MIQDELPFTIQDWGGIGKLYRDQRRGSHYHASTLHQMEISFIEEITTFDGDQTEYKELRGRIRRNPHLHFIIIQNLVDNLDRVWKEKTERS